MTSYEILNKVPNFSQSWQYEEVMVFPVWNLLKNRTVRKYIYYNNTLEEKEKSSSPCKFHLLYRKPAKKYTYIAL